MIFAILGAVAAAVIALYLFMIMPRVRKPADVSAVTARPIAHRGFFDNKTVTENSLGSYEAAAERNFAIEIDVHLTSDGVPVVIHDSTVDRVTEGRGRIDAMTLDELKKIPFKAGDGFVPTLREVLDTVDGRVPLLIELKEGANPLVAEKSYEVLKDYRGPYAIQSFHPLHLRRWAKLSPGTPRGILADNHRGRDKFSRKAGIFFLENMYLNFICRPDFISVTPGSLKNNLSIKLCTLFGAKKFAWTLREPEQYEVARKAGFDGYICENLDRLPWKRDFIGPEKSETRSKEEASIS
ncbi:MAG: hypothetical protein IKR53_01845 [Clostridia bacterium]|nr:hypothetical protein [Clostridia bacterium]